MLPGFELGGAERQALHVARYLSSEHGANIQVVGNDAPGLATELCEEYGIPWARVPWSWPSEKFKRLNGLIKFARDLRKYTPDILMPYGMPNSVLCGLVWKWTGAKVCIWNQRDEGRGRLGRKAEQMAVRQTPWFLSNSQHGMNFLCQSLGASSEKIRVIYNGIRIVQPLTDRVTWRRVLGVDDNCFVICMLANLHEYKDHITLLKAWRIVVSRLNATGRSGVLVLAGRFDSTTDKLKALAFDLELFRNVRFLGVVKDISGLLSAVDLGVHSSKNEGCPNAVLECMAYGLPVIGTDIGGIREAVGVDGYPFLAPPDEVEPLANLIWTFVVNKTLRAEIGAINLRRIKQEFSLDRMCEQTARFLSEVS